MFKFALLALFIVVVTTTPEFHHFIHVSEDGAEIPQDIVYDEDDQFAIITVGPIPQSECGIPTINFHDFITGYLAYKDVNASICYLARPLFSPATSDLFRMKKSSRTVYSHGTVSEEVMSPFLVKQLAGERIYNFCMEYDTYWMEMEFLGRTKRAARGICFLCTNCTTFI